MQGKAIGQVKPETCSFMCFLSREVLCSSGLAVIEIGD